MLLARTQFKVILYSTLFGLSALLSCCGNSQQIEQLLSADPDLIKLTTDETDKVSNPRTIEDIRLTKLPKEKSQPSSEIANNSSQDNNSTPKQKSQQTVPELPENLPFYPQATLEAIAPESTPEKGVSQWRSPESIATIVSYYQEKWQAEDWQIIQPFKANSENNSTDAIISRDNLKFKVSLTPSQTTEDDNQATTNLNIIYQVAKSGKSTTAKATEETETTSEQTVATEKQNGSIEKPKIVASPNSDRKINSKTQSYSFADVTEVPEQLQEYVQDLAVLGVITPKVKNKETLSLEFKPNETITRREYAKWLVKANNKYYGDSPRKKIHLANKSTDVAFKDIGINDPDFAEIQGLAEAGLIPSMLSGDSSKLLFRPDAPLTREDLITWKVPLDVRKALPKADVTAIQEAWGFQDASKIDPKALQALFADYQNSDRSNVNRIFGYTTLFQPKKAVTRAEAAASLWYFGFQGDGITAQEILSAGE